MQDNAPAVLNARNYIFKTRIAGETARFYLIHLIEVPPRYDASNWLYNNELENKSKHEKAPLLAGLSIL